MKKRDYFLMGLLALALRLINLGSDSLWYDEAFTRWIAKLPTLDRVMAAVGGDVHPPTYYVMEWLIVRVFGASEFTLRLPSALFGVAAVLLVMQLCRALNMPRRTIIIAGIIAAFLPAAIYYSQEARAYSMMSVFVLLIMIGAIRERWIVFMLGAIGTTYSHNLGVLYVFGIGLAVLFFHWRAGRNLWRIVAVLVGVVGAWSPWTLVMLHQLSNIAGGFWTPPVGLSGIIQPVSQMTLGLRTTEAMQSALIPAAFGLTGISLVSARHWLHSRPGAIYIAAMFGVPALAVVASLLWRPVYISRAFLASGMLVAPLWAYTWGNFRGWNKRLYAMVLIPAMLIGVTGQYNPAKPRSTAREIGDILAQLLQPGDVCYFLNIPSQINLDPYLHGCYAAIDPQAGDLNQSLSSATKIAFGFNQIPLPLPKGFKRVWITVVSNFGSSERELAMIQRVKHYGKRYYVDSQGKIELYLLDMDEVRAIWL